MLKKALETKNLDDFIFVGVLSVKKNQTAKDGRTYHVLEISDSETKAKLYYWNQTCDFVPKTFIKFKGEVVANSQSSFFSCAVADAQTVDFNDLPSNCQTRKVLFRFEVDVQDFVQKVVVFTEKHVKDASFKTIILTLAKDNFLSILKPYPAGKSAHHSLEGGLLKHIEEMFDTYASMADVNVVKDLRHEFIIIGILLHDYFKYKDYIELEEGFQITESNSLLGHIYQGASFLQKLMTAFNKMNPDAQISELDQQKAIHVLLAHHGQLDWGSPVVPAIPEAALLHYIDQISAKLNMFKYSNNLEFNKFLGTYPVK